MADGDIVVRREIDDLDRERRPIQPREVPPRESSPRAAPPPRQAPPRSRRKLLRPILLIGGPLLLIAAVLYFYLTGGRYVSTDNAYIQADKLAISTDVSGFVAAIPVHEGQHVAAGEVLFRLDDEPYRIALSGAEAQLAATRNQIQSLQASYREKQAEIKQAETDTAFYEREFARQAELVQRSNTPQSKYDEARRNLDSARQKVTMLRQQAQGILAQLGGDPDQPVESQAAYRQAQAQVDRAKRDLRRTIVAAPMAGIVTNVDKLQIGQYLPAAQAAFSLVATDHVWVEANPKETDLTYVKPGDPATVTVDTYPGREWQAKVASISPATGAEFSVLPAQNTSGNWVKVVQRIPVRLRVEVPDEAPQLRAGMSVEVSIDTGHERTFAGLVETARRWIGL